MRYTSNNSQVFGGGVIATIKYEDIESDNFNIYNTTTGIATIPHLGFYEVSCKTGTSAALGTNQTAQVLLETSLGRKSSDIIHGSGAASFFSNFASVKGVLLNQGDTVRCDWFSQAGVNLDTGDGQNFIEIIEQPDFKSTVANLMQGQTTKCQTKYLSANVVVDGAVSDLEFNNLSTLNTYSLTVGTSFVNNTNNTCSLFVSDGSEDIVRLITREADAPSDRTADTITNPFFNPATTTLTFTFDENTACSLEGNGTYAGTWATLCELPSTVIETDEFD
jgi:hypothetical protein